MPSKANAILFGAIVTAILSTSYIGLVNMLCCAGAIAGGVAAVWKYTNENQLTLRAGQGAQIGFLAVLLGALAGFILSTVLRLIGLRDDLLISQFVINTWGERMPPEQLDLMRAQMEQSPLKTAFSFSSLLGLLVSAGFGTLGGILGAALFKKGGDVKPEQTY